MEGMMPVCSANVPIEEQHQDSGAVCCVGHLGEPQCIQCRTCGEFIRPHQMKERCPRKRTERPEVEHFSYSDEGKSNFKFGGGVVTGFNNLSNRSSE
jgi:hypothetical protein